MKQFFSLFLLCMCCTIAFAQNRQIKGKVMDETGAGLAGVSVLLSGANNGVQTDASGNFSITAPGTGAVTLTISYSGYKSQTIKTDGKSEVSITLEKDVTALEDVVVIGYGTIKRKDLTGTVSSIGAAELSKIPVSSAAEAITGRLPGVQVTSVDGAPGAEIVIRVRGGGSVTQDNSPLYIVDGFPVNNINDIAPSDIASIDILKDAATTAIYGARGANGVVIISTKNAKAGKTTITFNSFGTARTLPRQLEVLSPYEFVLANYEYARLQNQTAVDGFTKYFGAYEDLELYKYQKGTNWQQELFGKPVYSQQHNLGITGGTAKTKFSLSATNNTDQGLMQGSGYQRNYLNFKLNHELAKNLKLDYSSRFVHTVTDGAGSSGSSNFRIGDAITTRPVNGIADFIQIDPNPGGTDDDYEQFLKSLISPTKLLEQDYRKRLAHTLNMNAAATWNVIPSLIYRTEFGMDLTFGQLKRYYGPLTSVSRNEGSNLPMGEITNSNARSFRWANTLTYKKEIGKHDFTVLGGQEINILNKGFSEYTRAKLFVENTSPERMFANMQLGTTDRHTTNIAAGQKLASFFGRINYQYDSRYLLTLTLRADASTKFSPEKQWGYFPAAAFAWRVSRENFMSNIKWIDDLKFRISYGAAGNDRIADNIWRVLFQASDNRTIGFGDVANPYYTYATSSLPNPFVQWETNITRNTGLDFTLFKQRLTGALDFYWNSAKNLLVLTDIPQNTGFSTQQQNIGQTSNKGVELGLNATVIQKRDFQLNATFNIGFNKAKIDNLGGPSEKSLQSNWASTDLKQQDDYRVYVGQTIGLMYGYVTDGWYTTDDFASYNPITRTYTLKAGVPTVGSLLGGTIGVRPGTMKLRDLDSNGVINASDRKVIGSALPKYSGGFGLSATIKNFDISAYFNFVVGNDVYNTGKIQFNQFYRTSYGNMLNTVNSDNRYKYIDGAGNLVTDLTELGKLNANAKIWSPFSFGTATPVFHSWAVEDGSFLRLNTLTVGYSLPKRITSVVRMTKVRVYATVYNAFLWTKYSGYDPEVSSTRSDGYSQLTPGVDYSAYPKSRNFTAGINVTF
ncbi:MAG: SusC/RagA family TonB-linked outer membrane protein [Lacibacter sp.]